MEATIKMLGVIALTIIFQSITEIDWISYIFGVVVVVYINAIEKIFKEKNNGK
jgi:hypothetical protein